MEHARGEGSKQEVQAAISEADGGSAKDRRGGRMFSQSYVYNSIEEVEQRAEAASSTLIAFFCKCAQNETAHWYLYQEFPQFYTWNKSKKTWSPRKRGFALGCIYYAPPKSGERFYLRLLLTTVRGPTSFENIRTVDGEVKNTFKDACNALGLLESDGEWNECLRSAAIIQTGTQLRQLFVMILKESSPVEPLALVQVIYL